MHYRRNRGCGEGTIVVLFRPDVLDLASADANALSYGGTVVLSNTGALAVGPVTMSAGALVLPPITDDR